MSFIRCDDFPGLRDFTHDYYGGAQPTRGPWRYFASAVVPLDIPAGRDLMVRWAAAGERCTSFLHEMGQEWGPAECIECDGSGYTRQPVDLSAFRDLPDGLKWACERVRDGKPVLGVLGADRRDGNGWLRGTYSSGNFADADGRPGAGWLVAHEHQFIDSGPEYGPEGQRVRDEAARAAGWWLL